MQISQACLDRFQQKKMDFKRRFITVDEIWIHHYTPERKEQSKQWIEVGGVHQRRQREFHQQEKLWQLFFGITKMFC